MTPTSHDRSMVEDIFVAALDVFINDGTESEKQLAGLAKDIIAIAGENPGVIEYLNKRAAG